MFKSLIHLQHPFTTNIFLLILHTPKTCDMCRSPHCPCIYSFSKTHKDLTFCLLHNNKIIHKITAQFSFDLIMLILFCLDLNCFVLDMTKKKFLFYVQITNIFSEIKTNSEAIEAVSHKRRTFPSSNLKQGNLRWVGESSSFTTDDGRCSQDSRSESSGGNFSPTPAYQLCCAVVMNGVCCSMIRRCRPPLTNRRSRKRQRASPFRK